LAVFAGDLAGESAHFENLFEAGIDGEIEGK
jgi:hypothetical protein